MRIEQLAVYVSTLYKVIGKLETILLIRKSVLPVSLGVKTTQLPFEMGYQMFTVLIRRRQMLHPKLRRLHNSHLDGKPKAR